jgi:pimeloyl-ACP methyl ester carboxylesterase
MVMTRVFIHGLESSSQGDKGRYFQEHYPGMIITDYFGSLQDRMQTLRKQLEGKTDLILVGSSFGGLMAAIFTCEREEQVRKLILLAPALSLGGFDPYLSRRLSVPTVLFHGSEDDIVPPEPVKSIAETIFLNLSYNRVFDDHSLHGTFATMAWDSLLE